MIDEEQPDFSSRADFGWTQYYNLEDIYSWLDQLLKQYPDVLKNYNYGKSYEGRTLRAVKVSHKPVNTKVVSLYDDESYKRTLFIQGRPTIFIESTIHAREWVTAATTTYILNELLSSNDPEIREIADSYDFVIIPVVNVDGYAYTHSKVSNW